MLFTKINCFCNLEQSKNKQNAYLKQKQTKQTKKLWEQNLIDKRNEG